ncbi:hypothetical protein RHMOL_Rhmol08G0143700 [Rhododendron molle]|uniref:Uncharacterized protein n=1 Tax=Rhododendron molle TaxID=49168 RepID=A0ACC0MPL1_RHOML|nr:hypothetical protein RHMOL_Rhmol08G0143700 [Rhododendron molle]
MNPGKKYMMTGPLKEAEDMEIVNLSHGDASLVDLNYHGDEVGESSKSNTVMEVCDALVAGTLRTVSEGTTLSLRSLVKPETLGLWKEAGENLVQPGGMKCPSPTKYCNQPHCPFSTSPFSMIEGPPSSSQFSCVTTSPMLQSRQLSFEVSLSDKVGDYLQNTASRPRNLRTKRIMTFWRNRVWDCGPTSAKQPSNHKQKKLDKVNANFGCGEAVRHPSQRKWKRERIIEADPHAYCIPQRREFV